MSASLAALSAGTRAAGIVVSLGYLLGLVNGSIVALVGGLALITFGRVLLLDRWEGVLSGAALAIAAGALGVAAVRWQELGLDALRGIQAVVGPTLLVEPGAAAAASVLAAAAAAIAFGLWLGGPLLGGRAVWLWLGAEGAVAALAMVSVFWGPALPGRGSENLGSAVGGWALATAVVLAVVGGLMVVIPRFGVVWRWVVLGIAALAVFAAAGLMASAG